MEARGSFGEAKNGGGETMRQLAEEKLEERIREFGISTSECASLLHALEA
jgi:hypothetical protein